MRTAASRGSATCRATPTTTATTGSPTTRTRIAGALRTRSSKDRENREHVGSHFTRLFAVQCHRKPHQLWHRLLLEQPLKLRMQLFELEPEDAEPERVVALVDVAPPHRPEVQRVLGPFPFRA